MNILNKLTIKHLTMNKKRTIVTIIGVILSTALMVGIGLLISSMRDYMIKEVISYRGSHHAVLYNVPYSKLKELNNFPIIKNIDYEKGIGFSYLNDSDNQYKPYLFINSGSDEFLKNLKLIEGRRPENKNEVVISEHIISNAKVNLKVGDILNLKIGPRIINDLEVYTNSELVDFYDRINDNEIKSEYIDEKFERKFKIVGIVERSNFESYQSCGYSIFTVIDDKEEGFVNTYIEYKQLKDVRGKTSTIAKALGMEPKVENDPEIMKFNESLLSLAGESKYNNFNTVAIVMMTITLSLISIACIIVIYNSFAISVMERKKQFGLFSSIGATRKQLRKTVFFEAFIIGIIGIILGLVGSFIGIGSVIMIINYLLTDLLDQKIDLVIYPLFVIIPIVFMIIVLIISAYLPAKQASKISPIEAIRLNDDIKIKSKKLKTSKLFQKLFGVEGEIALKSIKRNKKKYRITIISLFISIVLFISFSSYINYIINSARISMDIIDYDISIDGTIKDESTSNELFNKLKSLSEVNNIIMYSSVNVLSDTKLNNFYKDEYKKAMSEYQKANKITEENSREIIVFITIDQDNYNKIYKKLNLNEDKFILLNNYNLLYYQNNNKRQLTGTKFNNVNKLNFKTIFEYYDKENNKHEEEIIEVSNLVELKEVPLGLQELLNMNVGTIIIVSEEQYNLIEKKFFSAVNNTSLDGFELSKGFQINLSYDSKEEIAKVLTEYKTNNNIDHLYYYDIKEDQKMMNNILIVINILVYGFITLVTLIGITSVFNTINTSMALRRKEFVVLRSIGLTPKGFNKILQFETLIFGLKSLLYALPVSFAIVYMIHMSMSDLVTFGNVIIPWKAVIIAIIGVFVIVAITMMYATKKIKNENILDCIREENI